MTTSIYIARVIGPMLLLSGASLLAKSKAYCAIAEEVLASRALIFITGFMTLLIGLGIANAPTSGRPGWPDLLRIVGWLFVASGAFRMLSPDAVRQRGAAMLKKRGLLLGAGIVYLLLGLSLTYAGYARFSGLMQS